MKTKLLQGKAKKNYRNYVLSKTNYESICTNNSTFFRNKVSTVKLSFLTAMPAEFTLQFSEILYLKNVKTLFLSYKPVDWSRLYVFSIHKLRVCIFQNLSIQIIFISNNRKQTSGMAKISSKSGPMVSVIFLYQNGVQSSGNPTSIFKVQTIAFTCSCLTNRYHSCSLHRKSTKFLYKNYEYSKTYHTIFMIFIILVIKSRGFSCSSPNYPTLPVVWIWDTLFNFNSIKRRQILTA